MQRNRSARASWPGAAPAQPSAARRRKSTVRPLSMGPRLIPAREDSGSGDASAGAGAGGGLRVPDRIRNHGQLAASDAIVSIDLAPAALWGNVEARLARRIGDRWPAVAELLRPLFDSAAIRPALSGLTRGMELRAQILRFGRVIGEVTLDAVAVGTSFTAAGENSIEFEAGTESQAGYGVFRESRWRAIGGLYVKADFLESQYRGTIGGYRDSSTLDQQEDSGRVVAKTKTVEPGVLFHGLIEVGVLVAFDVEPAPIEQAVVGGQTVSKVTDSAHRHTVDVEVTISMPRADTRDADGNLPAVTEHYAPPARIKQLHRFGSTDVIWDLHLTRRALTVPGSSARLLPQATPEWMNEIDAGGQSVFASDWPRVAGQIATQVQPSSVLQRLKEMGSGQPIVIHDLPSGASVEVTARLVRLEHVRGTEQTEFTAGTEVRRRDYSQVIVTKAGTAPLPGQVLSELPDFLSESLGVTGSAGRDHMLARSADWRTGMQAKAKVRGEVFDGQVELLFKMRYAPRSPRYAFAAPREKTVRAHAGVRAVIERDEAVRVTSHAETVWETGQADGPGTGTALPSAQRTIRDAAGTGGLPLPPEEVWSRGLPDTSVILDLWEMDRLRDELRQQLTAVVSARHQAAVQSAVLNAYAHNRLMAHLAAMTRGVTLEGAPIPRLGAGGFRIAATAEVETLTVRRRAPKVELSPQGDTGTQHSDRRFRWWSVQAQAQLGGRLNQAASQLLLPTAGGQYRDRTGTRLAVGGQAVTNAKFGVPLVYFEGRVRLSFTASMGSKKHQFEVSLPFETGLPAGLTRTLEPPGDNTLADIRLPASAAEYHQVTGHRAASVVPPVGYLVAKPGNPARFAVPERVQNGRLSRSDFVLSISPDSNRLARLVAKDLKPLLGDAAARQVRHQLDTAAVKSQIPGMTSGDVIRVRVSGNGWSGYVSVTATARRMAYRESATKVEFENGTDNYTTIGLSVEGRHRKIGGLQARVKGPHSSLAISGNGYQDSTEGLVVDTTGREIARGKTVETGALLAGEIEFLVDYHLRFGALGFPRHSRVSTVSVGALVMVPERDMRTFPASDEAGESAGTVPLPHVPERWFAAPERIRRSQALSSSDIVLDVWPDQHDLQPGSMADVLRDDSFERSGRFVYGRDWPAMREKILAEMDFPRLRFELRAMTAGHPITVQAPRGTAGRALITARVTSARHVSGTTQTEFNTGTARVRDQAAADPRATTSRSKSGNVSVQVLGNTDPTGHIAGVQAGVTLAGYLGTNEYEFLGSRSTAGMTTKVKAPGAVYDGRVSLQIRLESGRRRNRVQVHQGAQVNVRFLAEQAESEPVGSEADTVFNGQPLRGKLPGPSPAEPVAPPARVWGLERGEGLSDTDTVRGLPDTGGLLQALEPAGEAVFTGGDWRRVAPVVRGVFSHASLAAALPAMTRTEAVLNPLAFGDLAGRFPEAEITARARVVRMEHQRTIAKAELNPVNEFTAQSSLSEQYWLQGGLQAQVGPEVGPVSVEGVLGGLHRHREAGLVGSTGRAIANAKYPVPSAIFDADVLITISVRQGGRKRVITGVIPAQLGIPLAETTPSPAGETTFLAPELEEPDPEPAVSPSTGEEKQARALLGAGHGFSADRLALAFGVVTRLGGPGPISMRGYLRWLGNAVGMPADSMADRRQLLRLLGVAGEVFPEGRVAVSDMAALRRLGDAMTTRVSGGLLRRARPVSVRELRAEYELRGLGTAAEASPARLSEMVGIAQAERLLGAGHGLSPQALARAWKLARRIHPVGPGVAQAPTAGYLRRLGVEVGLHHQDAALARWTREWAGTVDIHRLFELLNVAAEVFPDGPVMTTDLRNLRRLGDIVTVQPNHGRLRHRRPLTTDLLRAEYRRHHRLAGETEVTATDLQDLVSSTRHAKAARKLNDGGGRVRRADLRFAVKLNQLARARAAAHTEEQSLPPAPAEPEVDITAEDSDRSTNGAHVGRLATVVEEVAEEPESPGEGLPPADFGARAADEAEQAPTPGTAATADEDDDMEALRKQLAMLSQQLSGGHDGEATPDMDWPTLDAGDFDLGLANDFDLDRAHDFAFDRGEALPQSEASGEEPADRTERAFVRGGPDGTIERVAFAAGGWPRGGVTRAVDITVRLAVSVSADDPDDWADELRRRVDRAVSSYLRTADGPLVLPDLGTVLVTVEHAAPGEPAHVQATAVDAGQGVRGQSWAHDAQPRELAEALAQRLGLLAAGPLGAEPTLLAEPHVRLLRALAVDVEDPRDRRGWVRTGLDPTHDRLYLAAATTSPMLAEYMIPRELHVPLGVLRAHERDADGGLTEEAIKTRMEAHDSTFNRVLDEIEGASVTLADGVSDNDARELLARKGEEMWPELGFFLTRDKDGKSEADSRSDRNKPVDDWPSLIVKEKWIVFYEPTLAENDWRFDAIRQAADLIDGRGYSIEPVKFMLPKYASSLTIHKDRVITPNGSWSLGTVAAQFPPDTIIVNPMKPQPVNDSDAKRGTYSTFGDRMALFQVYLIIHEYGHHLQDLRRTLEGMGKRLPPELRKLLRSHVSEYAPTNPIEAIAELFTKDVAGFPLEDRERKMLETAGGLIPSHEPREDQENHQVEEHILNQVLAILAERRVGIQHREDVVRAASELRPVEHRMHPRLIADRVERVMDGAAHPEEAQFTGPGPAVLLGGDLGYRHSAESLLTRVLNEVADGDPVTQLRAVVPAWFPLRGVRDDRVLGPGPAEAGLASGLGGEWRLLGHGLGAVMERLRQLGHGSGALLLSPRPIRYGTAAPDNARFAYGLRNMGTVLYLADLQAAPGQRLKQIQEPADVPALPAGTRVIVVGRDGRAVRDPFAVSDRPRGGEPVARGDEPGRVTGPAGADAAAVEDRLTGGIGQDVTDEARLLAEATDPVRWLEDQARGRAWIRLPGPMAEALLGAMMLAAPEGARALAVTWRDRTRPQRVLHVVRGEGGRAVVLDGEAGPPGDLSGETGDVDIVPLTDGVPVPPHSASAVYQGDSYTVDDGSAVRSWFTADEVKVRRSGVVHGGQPSISFADGRDRAQLERYLATARKSGHFQRSRPGQVRIAAPWETGREPGETVFVGVRATPPGPAGFILSRHDGGFLRVSGGMLARLVDAVLEQENGTDNDVRSIAMIDWREGVPARAADEFAAEISDLAGRALPVHAPTAANTWSGWGIGVANGGRWQLSEHPPPGTVTGRWRGQGVAELGRRMALLMQRVYDEGMENGLAWARGLPTVTVPPATARWSLEQALVAGAITGQAVVAGLDTEAEAAAVVLTEAFDRVRGALEQAELGLDPLTSLDEALWRYTGAHGGRWPGGSGTRQAALSIVQDFLSHGVLRRIRRDHPDVVADDDAGRRLVLRLVRQAVPGIDQPLPHDVVDRVIALILESGGPGRTGLNAAPQDGPGEHAIRTALRAESFDLTLTSSAGHVSRLRVTPADIQGQTGVSDLAGRIHVAFLQFNGGENPPVGWTLKVAVPVGPDAWDTMASAATSKAAGLLERKVYIELPRLPAPIPLCP
ncbi:MAG TPA: hypothetical protein VIZ43_12405 [Trebonia sp.]